MIRTVKINEIFYPGIDTDFSEFNIAGEFNMELTKASDGTVVTNAIPNSNFEEINMAFVSHSAEVSAATNAGRTTINVINSNIEVGDVIKVANDFYGVKKVSTNGSIITINGKLKNQIASGLVIITSGKTGIYKIPVEISVPGLYFFTVFHKKFGHTAIKYKVVSTNANDIMVELQSIKDKIEHKGFI